MNILENIKTSVGQRNLTREYILNKRKVAICNIEKAANIGILFDATNSTCFDIIRKFVKELENARRNVEVFGYVDDKKLIDHYLYRKGFEFINRSHLNWYKKPINDSVDKFIKTKFDVLFYLSLDEIYPLQYVLALSKAKLKVGKYSTTQQFLDVMISIEKEKEAMNGIRKEIVSSINAQRKQGKEYEQIASSKANVEIQLNFLINQLMHYLSLLKK